MAAGRKTGGKDFKAGQSGNPKGREPINKEVRDLKKLNQNEFIELVSHYLRMNTADLKLIAKDPNAKSIDLMVISLIIKTINNGDYARFNFLLDRTIGKVKEKIEHTGTLTLEDLVAGSMGHE